MVRMLGFDGLDILRDRLDQLAMEHHGWVFRIVPLVPELSALGPGVTVEAYHKESSIHLGMAIAEDNYDSVVGINKSLSVIESSMKQALEGKKDKTSW